MKTIKLMICRAELLLATLLCGIQFNASAGDVTGDRLKIGASGGSTETLPNTAASTNSSICGGDQNTINAAYSTIAGGQDNAITNDYSFVGGGAQNFVVGAYAAVVGGDVNYVDGQSSFIGGGELNYISGGEVQFSTIAGGQDNTIGSNYSSIGGGGGNTISNYYSTIAGGYVNTNTGEFGAIGGGGWNLVQGDWSVIPGGVAAMTTMYGQSAHASGSFTYPDQGDAQTSEYVLRNVTTTTNATELFLDGTSLRMVLPTNGTWSFEILVSVRESNGNSGGFKTNGVIKTYGATTTMVGGVNPVTVPVIAADVGSWKVSVSADNAHGALAVKVNGDGSTNRWVATIRTTEVKY